MNLPYRLDLLVRLGKYILSEEAPWLQVKEKAGFENGWFIPEFVDLATGNIARNFLQKNLLEKWLGNYQIPLNNAKPENVGIVMAGNIPLVGFHDFLCAFISGHIAMIKPSTKDKVLFEHLVQKLIEWDDEIIELVRSEEMLKGCNAYIATGSNNSSRYFDYYFKKYPHIIRRNKTSVAIITGNETKEELDKLADDVYIYFGLGCRNVTKVYVPRGYDFIPMLEAFKKYNYLSDHHKYKNNYDYNLALHLLNNKYYMTNGSILLIEDPAIFSPISQLNYEFYDSIKKLTENLSGNNELQCVIDNQEIPFGRSQAPSLDDYADGKDTLQFLLNL